jgi:hypothetical protein
LATGNYKSVKNGAGYSKRCDNMIAVRPIDDRRHTAGVNTIVVINITAQNGDIGYITLT